MKPDNRNESRRRVPARGAAARGTARGRRGTAARPIRAKKPQARAPKPRVPLRENENLKTALWLLVPPIGLTRMWRRSCTWSPAVKACVSVAMAAVLLAVLIVPTNRRPANGGVQLVTNRPEVEVYGPDLPSFIVPGYTNEQADSIIVPAVENDVHYVYAADGARCYHEYKCKFAFASSQRLTVFEAYYLGFEPCNRCKPPLYDPVTGTITMQEHGDDYDPS